MYEKCIRKLNSVNWFRNWTSSSFQFNETFNHSTHNWLSLFLVPYKKQPVNKFNALGIEDNQ